MQEWLRVWHTCGGRNLLRVMHSMTCVVFLQDAVKADKYPDIPSMCSSIFVSVSRPGGYLVAADLLVSPFWEMRHFAQKSGRKKAKNTTLPSVGRL